MPSRRLLTTALLLGLALVAGHDPAHAATGSEAADYSGRIGRGSASVLSTADSGRYDPQANSVASSTLPKGATARVTNLRNRRTTIVLVQEHRPAPKGEIIEVSQRVAGLLGMPRNGTTTVQVAPLAVPQANGSIRLGRGTPLAGRRAYVTEPR